MLLKMGISCTLDLMCKTRVICDKINLRSMEVQIYEINLSDCI